MIIYDKWQCVLLLRPQLLLLLAVRGEVWSIYAFVPLLLCNSWQQDGSSQWAASAPVVTWLVSRTRSQVALNHLPFIISAAAYPTVNRCWIGRIRCRAQGQSAYGGPGWRRRRRLSVRGFRRQIQCGAWAALLRGRPRLETGDVNYSRRVQSETRFGDAVDLTSPPHPRLLGCGKRPSSATSRLFIDESDGAQNAAQSAVHAATWAEHHAAVSQHGYWLLQFHRVQFITFLSLCFVGILYAVWVKKTLDFLLRL